MPNSTILGSGFYVPPKVVTNDDLAKLMDTSDEWIRERTGIRERHYAEPGVGAAALAKFAAERAIADAGLVNDDIEMIIFATLNPDIFFPGSGCFLQSLMKFKNGTPALDIRQQCTGFIYAVSVADQFIRSGRYQRILVIGAENHSSGIEFATRGRDVTVIFGDGAGAVVMGPTENPDEGLLAFSLHADGEFYDKLWVPGPRGDVPGRVNPKMIEDGDTFPHMDGRTVFKHAVVRFPEAMEETLGRAGKTMTDVDLFIPHQANERITRFVQKKYGLPDEKVVSNIDRYGNTTAATIPICICESRADGRLKKGGLLLCAAFGSGFTWGGFVMKWTIDGK